MTIAPVLDALAAPHPPAADVVAAAVVRADALLPAIADLARKAGDGVVLVPRQERLLSRGLYVAAEARRTEVYRPLLAILGRPEYVLRRILGDGSWTSLDRLLLATFDGDVAALAALVERRLLDGAALRAVLHVLARLAFDGAWSRDDARALLEAFDTEGLADDGDVAWRGWQDAIALLGFSDMAGRVASSAGSGRTPALPGVGESWDGLLASALAAPEDPARFELMEIHALDDAAAAIAALRPPEDDADERSDRAPDPAVGVALSDDEIDWLDIFLLSDHVPPSAFSIEEVDGLFCALVAGPASVPEAEWMATLLGDDAATGPDYADDEQAAHVARLLDRHMRTIALRLSAGQPHFPLLEDAEPDEMAMRWGQGFGAGAGLRAEAWDQLLQHRRHGAPAAALLALAIDAEDENEDEEAVTGREREDLIEDLPWMLLTVYRHWHQPATPLRSTKVGRNAPCPCGSGRKYKVCHGAAGGPPPAG